MDPVKKQPRIENCFKCCRCSNTVPDTIPAIIVSSNKRRDNLVNSPNSVGIVPDMAVFDKSKYDKAGAGVVVVVVVVVMVLGKVPVNSLLLESVRTDNCVIICCWYDDDDDDDNDKRGR